jgi:hypothetical protein
LIIGIKKVKKKKNLVKQLIGHGVFFWVFCLLSAPAQAANQDVDWDMLLYEHFSTLNSQTLRQGLSIALQEAETKKPNRQLTQMLVLARQHWNELSTDTQQLATPWLLRPTDNSDPSEADWRYTNPEATPIPTDHFLIHYIDRAVYATDNNAATTAFANKVAGVMEAVWTKEHGGLGYASVPSDLSSDTNGGDAKYDVYLTNLGASLLFGYVASEGFSNDTSRPNGAYSYMVLDNNFKEFGYTDPVQPLSVTAAHEYFHSIQMGYDYSEDASFMEQSATWMEDVVYPGIHDNYNYVGEPYEDTNGNGQFDEGEPYTDRNSNNTRDEGSTEFPELSLDSFTFPLQYGRFVWVRYLDERFGTEIVRTIWERCGAVQGENTFAAINYALNNNQSTLAVAYQEYATWNYDLAKFSDGANYPLVWVDRTITNSDLPVSSSNSPNLSYWRDNSNLVPQMHLSTVYTQLMNPEGDYTIEFSGGGIGALTMLVDTGQGALTHDVVSLSLNKGTWTAPIGALRVVAVISNVHESADNLSWTLKQGIDDTIGNGGSDSNSDASTDPSTGSSSGSNSDGSNPVSDGSDTSPKPGGSGGGALNPLFVALLVFLPAVLRRKKA